MSTNEIIVIIVAVLAVLLILCFVKKIMKLVVTVAIIVVLLLYLKVFSPSQLEDISSMVAKNSNVVNELTQLSKESDSIKVKLNKDGGVTVRIKISEDTWVSTDELKNIVSIGDDSCTVTYKDKKYTIDDEYVTELMKILKK